MAQWIEQRSSTPQVGRSNRSRGTKLNMNMIGNLSVEHLIVGATGIGYLIVGVLQATKGEAPNAMIWLGYAFAQVGLWLNIK